MQDRVFSYGVTPFAGSTQPDKLDNEVVNALLSLNQVAIFDYLNETI